MPDYGVAPTPDRVQRLGRFLVMLADWNRRMRLVGDAAPEILVQRHVGESLYAATIFEFKRQKVLDIGSGAGFPGVVLQLAFPDLDTTYVEATLKKAAFLREVSRVEGRGTVVSERAEQLQPIQAEVVTMRAVERMEAVGLRYASRHLAAGGTLLAWVGDATAKKWRRANGWDWDEFALLPRASERGILRGRWRG
jgi:16S rRNA (guanine527-N7)-methyltransferase